MGKTSRINKILAMVVGICASVPFEASAIKKSKKSLKKPSTSFSKPVLSKKVNVKNLRTKFSMPVFKPNGGGSRSKYGVLRNVKGFFIDKNGRPTREGLYYGVPVTFVFVAGMGWCIKRVATGTWLGKGEQQHQNPNTDLNNNIQNNENNIQDNENNIQNNNQNEVIQNNNQNNIEIQNNENQNNENNNPNNIEIQNNENQNNENQNNENNIQNNSQNEVIQNNNQHHEENADINNMNNQNEIVNNNIKQDVGGNNFQHQQEINNINNMNNMNNQNKQEKVIDKNYKKFINGEKNLVYLKDDKHVSLCDGTTNSWKTREFKIKIEDWDFKEHKCKLGKQDFIGKYKPSVVSWWTFEVLFGN